ncbi:MAG: serine hydrolase [Elusimicrobia bacterium]|nr:serine hydrolase [Elusimicrobiota bacterium]
MSPFISGTSTTAPLFTIHAAGKFIPASLLKVPLMLAVFRGAEEYPLFLHPKAPYEQQPDWTPSVATATLRPGEPYKIDQPLRAMVVDSDNGAAMILDSTIDPPAGNGSIRTSAFRPRSFPTRIPRSRSLINSASLTICPTSSASCTTAASSIIRRALTSCA